MNQSIRFADPWREGTGGTSVLHLTVIEGIDQSTSLVLLAESGPDLSRFGNSRRFCAWLGLCPQHRVSGGKVQSRRVRPGVNRAAQALRQAAWSLHASKGALGGY